MFSIALSKKVKFCVGSQWVQFLKNIESISSAFTMNS